MKTPVFSTLLVLVGIGFAIYIYFAFFNKPKVPPQFFTTFEANEMMTRAMLEKTTFDLQSFGTAYQAKDFPKALQLVTIGAIQNERNNKKFLTLSQKTVSLKILGGSITDGSAKEQTDKLFAAMDRRNAHIQKLLGIQKEFFTGLQTYFEGLVLQGGKEQQLNLDPVLQAMQAESKDIVQAQFQLDQLYGELKRLAGKDQTTGFVPKTSFTVTPEEEIVVTEIPVATPTIEIVPTIASESATAASGSGLH